MGNSSGILSDAEHTSSNVALMRAMIDKYESVRRSDVSVTDEELFGLLCEEACLCSDKLKALSNREGAANVDDASERAESEAACSGDGSVESLNVLVIDDSHLACKLAVRVLSMVGHVADSVLTGAEGLASLRHSPTKYNLVLLDIVMPELDGIEVLSRIKMIPELAKIPVVMLSGLEDQTLVETCLQGGASAVLLKPLSVDSVRNAVNQILQERNKDVARGCVSVELKPRPVGSIIPDLKLLGPHNQKYHIDAGNRGKAHILVFLPPGRSHSTGVSRKLIHEVVSAHGMIHDRGMEVCVIGQRGFIPEEYVKHGYIPLCDPDLDAFAKCMSVEKQDLNDRLEAVGLVVFSKDGRVIYSWGAAVSEQQLVDKQESIPHVGRIFRAFDIDTAGPTSHNEPLPKNSSGSKLSVLVVDDSSVSAKLAVRKLIALGLDTSHVNSGQAALDLLRKNNEFDLVLLDIVMPVMDGVEVLTTIQQDKNLSSIPVAMLSGLEDQMLVKACLESGAVAVLKKPLDTEDVSQLIISKGITSRHKMS